MLHRSLKLLFNVDSSHKNMYEKMYYVVVTRKCYLLHVYIEYSLSIATSKYEYSYFDVAIDNEYSIYTAKKPPHRSQTS